MTSEASGASGEQADYRVLARKYRPDSFDTLIGQDAMVRTLSNAIESGRLAHAFVLTGVRGVGKTTTARIIAKGLNCQTADGPTLEPCGHCDACTGIAASRHVDVLEMDAASRTGVGDIREIIESVRYAPVSARFKVYIIDEVHMLSTAAFNALLKTLEEPPEHVKFIFATTEIRKIPVTVLSRCQRFDLKRVEADTLVAHLAKITKAEGADADEGALRLIARAAEGSVRDSLSLLDQAIAHTGASIGEEQVRAMLGLADRTLVLSLFEQVMKGETASAITTLRGQYDAGADPGVVIGDMLEVAHWLTRLKVAPDAGADAIVSETEKTEGARLAGGLTLPHLTQAWQMLLKGLQEVRVAPSAIAAAEMVLIRLCHAANLPDPATLVKRLQAGGSAAAPAGQANPAGQGGGASSAQVSMHPQAQTGPAQQPTARGGAEVVALRPQDDGGQSDLPKHPMPVSFEKMVALFEAERRGILAVILKDQMKLVSYKPGSLTLVPVKNPPPDFTYQVKTLLKEWTGSDWLLTFERDGGDKTLRQKATEEAEAVKERALAEPLMKAFFATFKDAELRRVKKRDQDDEIPDDGSAATEDDGAPISADEDGDFDF